MSERSKRGQNSGLDRKTLTIERVYRASKKDVWGLWTTKDGIESWWGPGGFKVAVRTLDLRPGGELRYAMTAVDPDQVAFMLEHDMPLTTEAYLTYIEIVPQQRLAYVHAADFIPGVEPYGVSHVIELHQLQGGTVRMTLTIQAMHDKEWTDRAIAGWESELGKLESVLAMRVLSGNA
ncbi:MAG: SRPBCC domain-containing protein [Candidatus Eremiobacteraeota bacterium]|nr:SRPBCC domain-containing protein [Candidatus Eremiobacteraeota bacterium]